MGDAGAGFNRLAMGVLLGVLWVVSDARQVDDRWRACLGGLWLYGVGPSLEDWCAGEGVVAFLALFGVFRVQRRPHKQVLQHIYITCQSYMHNSYVYLRRRDVIERPIRCGIPAQ